MYRNQFLALCLSLAFLTPVFSARGESQGSEYKGITDPFGDPTAYEFAEDEKADKEFFHLGRFLMFGVDAGMGLFTGGLGKTNSPSFYVGGRLIYFFDKSLAFEGALHYVKHTDTTQPNSTDFLAIDTSLMPITAGFRFYFDVKNAPRAVALANPYLAAGAGMYIRKQTVLDAGGNFTVGNVDTTTSNDMGCYLGGGGEFLIYRRHIYLGVDFRYHAIFFADEDDTFGGLVNPGDRGGDYFSTALTLTYSF